MVACHLLKANAKINSIIGAESIGASRRCWQKRPESLPVHSARILLDQSFKATVLPLALVLVFGLPTTQLIAPVPQTQAFQSFLRQWRAATSAASRF